MQVLQSHESQFFWGPPGDQATSSYADSTLSSDDEECNTYNPDYSRTSNPPGPQIHNKIRTSTPRAEARAIHWKVEKAHTPEDLAQVLQNPAIDLLPETVSLALLRLAAWHTDVGAAAALDPDSMLEAVCHLENQIVRSCSTHLTCSTSTMADIVWALATLRGPSCVDLGVDTDVDDDVEQGSPGGEKAVMVDRPMSRTTGPSESLQRELDVATKMLDGRSKRLLHTAGIRLEGGVRIVHPSPAVANAPAGFQMPLGESCRWPGSDEVLDAVVEWGLGAPEPSTSESSYRSEEGVGTGRTAQAGSTSGRTTSFVVESCLVDSGALALQLRSCSTQCLVSMLWGFSALLDQAHQSDEKSSETTPVPHREVQQVDAGSSLSSSLSSQDFQWMVTAASASTALNCKGLDGLKKGNEGEQTDDDGFSAAFSREVWERRGLFLDRLCSELVERLQEVRTGSELHPHDITDVAWGLAVADRRSPAVGRLIEALAHEVYRQLSNRHSLNTAFLPVDLVKLLRAFADMKPSEDVTVPLMLDAVAGYVIKRIRARHVNAVTKPSDLVAILEAFDQMGHNSVVVPELLAAASQQLVGELASHSEWIESNMRFSLDPSPSSRSFPIEDDIKETDPSVPEDPVLSKSWRRFVSPSLIVRLMQSFRGRGVDPGRYLLACMLVAFLPQLPYCSPSTLCGLLTQLAGFKHSPGKPAAHMIMIQVEKKLYRFTASQLLVIVEASSVLELPIKSHVVDRACRLCLMGDFEDEEEGVMEGQQEDDLVDSADDLRNGMASSGNAIGPDVSVDSFSSVRKVESPIRSRDEGVEDRVRKDSMEEISGEEACRLLMALSLLNQVTIQRLGLTCMRVREDGLGVTTRHSSTEFKSSARLRAARSLSAATLVSPIKVLSPVALLAIACGMVLLGDEGEEMAEEVLPGDVFRAVKRCVDEARRLLESHQT